MFREDMTRYWRLAELLRVRSVLKDSQDTVVLRQAVRNCLHDCYHPDLVMELDVTGLPSGHYRICGIKGKRGESSEYQGGGPGAVHHGGLVGTIVESPQIQAICQVEMEDDPTFGSLAKNCHSLLAVPLPLGSAPDRWLMFLIKDGDGFARSHLEAVVFLTVLLDEEIRRHAALRQAKSLTEQMQRHGHRIAEIQQALLPQPLPEISGVTLAVSYEPDFFAGGDMYDVVLLPFENEDAERFVAFLIADVSGHGPDAAMVMAMIHGILRCYPRFTDHPAEILEYLNRHLYQLSLPEMFVTALLGFVWPKSRTLRYCRAGHPEPLLRLTSGEVKSLAYPGTYPLGLFPDAHCRDVEETLPPDSLLLLYTDGITDTQSPTRAPFGITSLESVLAAFGSSPQAAVNEVHRAVCQHQGTARQTDDRTILAMGIQ